LGSWKCGKGKAFTHIPTNIIILLKKILHISLFQKEGRKIIMIKRVLKKGILRVFPKKLLTLPKKNPEGKNIKYVRENCRAVG